MEDHINPDEAFFTLDTGVCSQFLPPIKGGHLGGVKCTVCTLKKKNISI